MICDSWFVIRDSWFVIRDSWFVIHNSRFVIRDSWFVIRDSWFVIRDSCMIHDSRRRRRRRRRRKPPISFPLMLHVQNLFFFVLYGFFDEYSKPSLFFSLEFLCLWVWIWWLVFTDLWAWNGKIPNARRNACCHALLALIRSRGSREQKHVSGFELSLSVFFLNLTGSSHRPFSRMPIATKFLSFPGLMNPSVWFCVVYL
jgi:hypothetical protein